MPKRSGLWVLLLLLLLVLLLGLLVVASAHEQDVNESYSPRRARASANSPGK